LLAAAEASGAVHAYRDAERAIRRALELWPDGHDEATRLDVLERLAGYAELAGDLAEAVPTWREVADGRRRDGDLSRLGIAHRRLAAVLELQGRWQEALANGSRLPWPLLRRVSPADAPRNALPRQLIFDRQAVVPPRLLQIAGAHGRRPGRPSGPDQGHEGNARACTAKVLPRWI
jgi:tetratricopeptide (TPR) repeat protein